MGLSFEWDPRKAVANEKKHGVAFKEAATVFGDPLAWFQPDAEHSLTERSLVALGAIVRRSIARDSLHRPRRRTGSHHQRPLRYTA